MNGKVLLVDDHAFLREALADVLRRLFPQAELLQAGSLETARSMLRGHADIELVLLDLKLPDGDGLLALPSLLTQTNARVVVMSADERHETIRAALQAGAAGYLPKTLDGDVMLSGLRKVVAGGHYAPQTEIDGADSPPRTSLSPRQTAVLALLINGASNKTIARELDITEATVKSHVSAIFNCFGVNSRTQVLAAVARRGTAPGADAR
jgi:DNA-binding NarL/FixJ family response regulator